MRFFGPDHGESSGSRRRSKPLQPNSEIFTKSLESVSFYLTLFKVDANGERIIGERISRQWSDLDNLLVRLWDSRSIRPRVVCTRAGAKVNDAETHLQFLLPEMARSGMIHPD